MKPLSIFDKDIQPTEESGMKELKVNYKVTHDCKVIANSEAGKVIISHNKINPDNKVVIKIIKRNKIEDVFLESVKK